MSTITVTSSQNSGAGTLRDALALANNGDTIVFSQVTGTLLTAPLVISKNVTIDASTVGAFSINNAPVVVSMGTTVTMRYLALNSGDIENGDAHAGGDGARGTDGTPGQNALTDGQSGAKGGDADDGGDGSDATGTVINAGPALVNNGTLTFDHGWVAGRAYGSFAEKGGQGGDGGNGGRGGNGLGSGNGAVGGIGGNGGPGGQGLDGGDAVGGVINTGTLTFIDSIITGLGEARDGGDGGRGGNAGVGGQGGSGHLGARGGTGGTGGTGGEGGKGGSAVGGMVNLGAVNIIGTLSFIDDAASAGAGGAGGVGGTKGKGGVGGFGSNTGLPGDDGGDGAIGASGQSGTTTIDYLDKGTTNGVITLGARIFGFIDTTPDTASVGTNTTALYYYVAGRTSLTPSTPNIGSVHWQVVTNPNGPALSDFIGATSGDLSLSGFAFNRQETMTITVQLKGNLSTPSNGFFTVELSNPTNGNVLDSMPSVTQHVVNLTALHTANDFNGDGRMDILFSQDGAVYASNYEWQMSDRAISAQGAVDLYDKSFTVQVVGDYDGDGKSDVVFQNPTTGGVWEWRLDGTSIVSQGAVDVADPSFHLLGSADFNGDGRDDLAFRNDAGFVYMWQMNGRTNTPLPVQGLDPSWHVQGAGDFDGDGRADFLLRNLSSTADNGAFFLWLMNGNAIIGQGGVERPPTDWKTLGLGDFDGDGKTDFAVRNSSAGGDNGAVWIYLMNGAAIKAQGAAGIADPNTWHVQEVGDLNGDGKDDILFRNDAGYFYSWNMNGTTIASEGLLGTQAGNWADPALHVVTPNWDLV